MWFLNLEQKIMILFQKRVSVHSMWFLNQVDNISVLVFDDSFRPLYVILKQILVKVSIYGKYVFPSTLCDS